MADINKLIVEVGSAFSVLLNEVRKNNPNPSRLKDVESRIDSVMRVISEFRQLQNDFDKLTLFSKQLLQDIKDGEVIGKIPVGFLPIPPLTPPPSRPTTPEPSQKKRK
jgi:hypothetical protein